MSAITLQGLSFNALNVMKASSFAEAIWRIQNSVNRLLYRANVFVEHWLFFNDNKLCGDMILC
jgi:hypothetical protein